jgi:HK97 family phage portal protein
MGFFDFLKLTSANNKEQLPPPNNYAMYAGGITGRGNGDLLALLQKKLPSSKKDWVLEAGDLSLNSIIAICSRWYLTNFSQVSFEVANKTSGQKEIQINDVIELLRDPMNGNVPPSIVWGNYIQDYLLLGNAYLRKIRGIGSSVIALEYLPADMVRPVGDSRVAVQYYIYTVTGQEYKIEKEDLIHWRYGRDTTDIRLGRSPVVSVLREVASDNQASTTAYGLIKNGALPSMIIGPDANDSAVDISPDDAKTIKKRLREDFASDNAGGIAVLSGAYKMERVSFSPNELNLAEIRRLPETRIPAALGLNAMCLGLNAGLENSTYSNYEQAQSAAWTDGMLPLLDSLCEILSIMLLPDFNPKLGDYIDYNVSEVRALAEDVYANSDRAALLYEKGVISRAEAKRMISLEPTPEDEDMYFNSVSLSQDVAKSIAEEILNTPIDRPSYGKSISFKYFATDGMKEAAKRALKWKEEGYDGGTRVGLARANQIVNGDNLSEDTVLRMYSFFSRHEVDKEAQGFNSGEEGYPSNGRVAWDLWGGDAGYSWSTKIRNRLMDEGKNIVPYEPED